MNHQELEHKAKLKSEYKEWLELREETKDKNGELCYCGHTYKCDCLDPDEKLFNESVKRGSIILNDKRNGWTEPK